MKYKTNSFGMLMRWSGEAYELFNFERKKWSPSKFALATFSGEEDGWDITEEEAAAMKQKNEEGLYSLLQKLAVHLDYVEKKYGYEVPNFEYTTTHFAEIQDDFVFGQVCNHIVEHANVLDMNKPEDVRIMHQIKFYNEVGIKAFSMFTSVATEQNIKFREDNVDRCRNLDSIADSMNYLKAA